MKSTILLCIAAAATNVAAAPAGLAERAPVQIYNVPSAVDSTNRGVGHPAGHPKRAYTPLAARNITTITVNGTQYSIDEDKISLSSILSFVPMLLRFIPRGESALAASANHAKRTYPTLHARNTTIMVNGTAVNFDEDKIQWSDVLSFAPLLLRLIPRGE